jgi:Abnormal spindle-like microcephaly-assoc'd, ASPM-SPD-2-Hydin
VRTLVAALTVLLALGGGSSALGGTPGPLSANPDPIDFQTIVAGDSPTIHVTITNDGSSQVTITDIGTSNGGGDLSAGGCGTLPTTLAPADTCQVDVTYAPGSAGSLPADASLDITDDDASSPQSFAVQGSARANRFQFTSGSGSFGTVAVGDDASRQFTVHNQTNFTADPNVHVSGGDAADFHVTGCGSGVGSGSDCIVTVTFSPSSAGPKSTTLQIDGDSLTLSGTGADPVTVQPTTLPFGDQHVGTTSPAQPITVTNNQNDAITVNVSGNPADYTVDASDCTSHQLGGSGGACTINVAFSPNSSGQQNESLTVEGQTVQLTGRGTAALLGVAPVSLSFGNQPLFTQSATQTITVTNNGNEAMTMNAPAVSGPGLGQFAISDGCQPISPIAPGDQCSVTVQFTPSATGAQDAVLALNSPTATNSPQTVALHGTGTPSAVAFVPGRATFTRPRHAGTFSTPKLITLTNKTSEPLTISGVRLGGLNPRSFRITAGNCAGKTLAADGSCTEKVRFAPNDVGVKSGSLVVDDDGPNGTHSVQLTGRATYPKDDVAVRGAVGCDATKITWRRGGSSRRFDSTVIVRSRTHTPTGPNDGTRLPHGKGVLHDRGLRHFTAYEYRVFALYRSHTRPGTFNHSRGIILRLRTGELCTPMDGDVIGDTTPTASWLRHATLFGYSFRIFHGGEEVQQPRFVHATSFTFSGRRRLHRGFTYTLFLYAYPASRPEGTAIGQTTFRVR